MRGFKYYSNRIKYELYQLRIYLFSRRLKKCGKSFSVRFPVQFEGAGFIEIGDYVTINSFVHIWGHGAVKIGDNVMIASHCAITSVTHDHTKDLMWKTSIMKPVVIEQKAWIGAHSVIMPGITIGEGAVVGAGSVVTKDVAPHTIVAGVPARPISVRRIDDLRV